MSDEELIAEILEWQAQRPELYKAKKSRAQLLQLKDIHSAHTRAKNRFFGSPARAKKAQPTGTDDLKILSEPGFEIPAPVVREDDDGEEDWVTADDEFCRVADERRGHAIGESPWGFSDFAPAPRPEADVEAEKAEVARVEEADRCLLAKKARLKMLLMRDDLGQKVRDAMRTQKPLRIDAMTAEELEELAQVIGVVCVGEYGYAAAEKLLGSIGRVIDRTTLRPKTAPCERTLLADRMLVTDVAGLIGTTYVGLSTSLRALMAFSLDVGSALWTGRGPGDEPDDGFDERAENLAAAAHGVTGPKRIAPPPSGGDVTHVSGTRVAAWAMPDTGAGVGLGYSEVSTIEGPDFDAKPAVI